MAVRRAVYTDSLQLGGLLSARFDCSSSSAQLSKQSDQKLQHRSLCKREQTQEGLYYSTFVCVAYK